MSRNRTPSARTSRRTPPTRRARRAAFVAATALIAAPLAGANATAWAADGKTPFYKSEQEAIDYLNTVAPLKDTAAIQGYPVTGQDTKEITREDVKKAGYSPEQAVEDAQAMLQGFGSTPGAENYGTEERASSKEDKDSGWLGNWDAKSVCGQPNDVLAKGEKKLACGFVGKIDKKYPVMATTDRLPGGTKDTYVTEASIAKEEKEVSGWKAGGKLTLSAMPDNKGGQLEGSAEYNESTETTNKWAVMAQQRRDFTVPDGMAGGTFQAHANAGWYTGYIVQKVDDIGGKAEKIVAIPARVLIQAPTDNVPLTWVGRES
ncbi:hypothetical protein AB0K49_11065 [Streptomyces decoyicus]|uniref:hypothetical protein n=1 Tax=Streptomyces decoyicus TaxID=249567 RepID=UPI00345D6BB5